MEQKLKESKLNEIVVQFIDPRKPLKSFDIQSTYELIHETIAVDRDYHELIMKSLRQLPVSKTDIDIVVY